MMRRASSRASPSAARSSRELYSCYTCHAHSTPQTQTDTCRLLLTALSGGWSAHCVPLKYTTLQALPWKAQSHSIRKSLDSANFRFDVLEDLFSVQLS